MAESRPSDLKSRMAAFTRVQVPVAAPPSPEVPAEPVAPLAFAEPERNRADVPLPPPAASLSPEPAFEPTPPDRANRISCEVPAELLEAARNAVVALSPTGLTLAGLVAQAMEAELARLEIRHNSGQPFPERPHPQLQRGRRIR